MTALGKIEIMKASASRNAHVDKTNNGWRLGITGEDDPGYRLAQLDDYVQLPRYGFPHRFLDFSLRARASSDSISGTWGFGLWNDPFGLSLGFGGNPFRLPALPNTVWFFHASPQNYLSFQDDKPACGFLAQVFRSSTFHPLLIPAGLVLPFSGKHTRRMLGKVIEEDGIALNVDVTHWHGYRLEWSPGSTTFYVDETQVFKSTVSPRGPLGVIVWVDNQYAAFHPDGKMAWGLLPTKDCWLEIENIIIA